jgi:hypothetical protein
VGSTALGTNASAEVTLMIAASGFCVSVGSSSDVSMIGASKLVETID